NTGTHTIMRLTSPLPKGPRKRGSKKIGWEFAFYDQTSNRYFCFTGRSLPGYETIRTIDPSSFYEDFSSGRWDPPPSHGNGNSGNSKNNGQANESHGLDKWARLQRGEWQDLYPSQSEADLALAGYFAAQLSG